MNNREKYVAVVRTEIYVGMLWLQHSVQHRLRVRTPFPTRSSVASTTRIEPRVSTAGIPTSRQDGWNVMRREVGDNTCKRMIQFNIPAL